jgi:hypothetical protein
VRQLTRRRAAWLAGVATLVATPWVTHAETVFVKYRGSLDLQPFECEWITRSSLVTRLCYDHDQQYLVVNLNGTYYHYCAIPPRVVDAWRSAESMGRFFNQQVKGRFDCRVSPPPDYKG